GGWLVGLALVIAGAACESPPDGGSSSGEAATAERTAQQQNQQRDRKWVSSGPFEYTRSIGGEGSKPGQLNQPIGLAVGEGG
ncbi:MAG: hypothetical protein ABEN55_16320, partial [Bradymonadaceae bacterium]